MSSKPARTQAILLLTVVFLLGVIVGGASIVLLAGPSDLARALRTAHHGSHRPPHVRLMHDLELTEAQRREVHRILMHRREELDALLDASRDELRSILNPEQMERFDTLAPHAPPHPPLHGPPPRAPRAPRP